MKLQYRSLKTISGNVGYAEIGKGTPLVLVVGYTGTLYHWNKEFVFELAKHFTLYLIDNRNIGLSKSSNEDSIHGFAKDVVDFIEAKKLKFPIILGWSLGGVICQELISFYTQNVKSIILISTTPNMKFLNTKFMSLLKNSDKYLDQDFREHIYYFFFSIKDVNFTKQLIKNNALNIENYNYRFTDDAKYLQNEIIPVWKGSSKKFLKSINIPTLLLWAKNDLVVNFTALKHLFTNINKSKTVIYDTGGHFLIHDNPTQIANDIANFFNK